MNKKSILGGLALAAMVAIAGCGQERAGVSAQSEPTVSVPTPNTSMLGSESTPIFDLATIALPTSWEPATSTPDLTVDFADKTNCTGSNADCPHVVFVNLASPKADEYYGEDVAVFLESEPCKSDPKEAEGPVGLKVDGEDAEYYRRSCGPEDEFTIYAWRVASKKLLVYTVNDNGGSSPQVAMAAVSSLRWE
jgi:hypothetical protein